MEYILWYFFIVNLIGLFIMYSDKQRARQKQWRIKEATIWWTASIGGALGCYFGMIWFRHKTKHRSFKLGLPVLGSIQVVGVVSFYLRLFS
ncbi:DUF1294 domain-containing protein [Metabacillus sp. HB246100]